MDKARQDSKWPTRKSAVSASIAGLIGPLSMIVSYHYGPNVLPLHIAEAYGIIIYAAVATVISIAAAILPHVGLAWFVYDRPNVPIRGEKE